MKKASRKSLTTSSRVQAFGLHIPGPRKYAARVAEATTSSFWSQPSRTPFQTTLGQRGPARTAAFEKELPASLRSTRTRRERRTG